MPQDRSQDAPEWQRRGTKHTKRQVRPLKNDDIHLQKCQESKVLEQRAIVRGQRQSVAHKIRRSLAGGAGRDEIGAPCLQNLRS